MHSKATRMATEHLLAVGTPGLATLSIHLQPGEFACGVASQATEPGGAAADSWVATWRADAGVAGTRPAPVRRGYSQKDLLSSSVAGRRDNCRFDPAMLRRSRFADRPLQHGVGCMSLRLWICWNCHHLLHRVDPFEAVVRG